MRFEEEKEENIYMKNLNKYLTPEIREMMKVVQALYNDEHWAVYIRLLEAKGEISSLTDLREEFESIYHEMKPILDDLIKEDLVEEFYINPRNAWNLDKRYYRVSIQGIQFCFLILDNLIPTKHHDRL